MKRGPPSRIGQRLKLETLVDVKPGGGGHSSSSIELSIQLSRRMIIVYFGLTFSKTSTLNPLRVDLQITFAEDESRTVSYRVTTVSSEVRVSVSAAFASFNVYVGRSNQVEI